MKYLVTNYLTHKELYIVSITFGGLFTGIMEFYNDFTQREIFGISAVLWFLLLMINLYDIKTGIRASTKLRNDNGEKFIFESKKGWRAMEKIFLFTVVIGFMYFSEAEVIRLKIFGIFSSIFFTIKLIFFIYVTLVEIQSIGENDEIVYGKKSGIFKLLDKIIDIANAGILNKVKKLTE